jgi:hypothetical protein
VEANGHHRVDLAFSRIKASVATGEASNYLTAGSGRKIRAVTGSDAQTAE